MSTIDSSLPIPTFQVSNQPCPKDLLDFLLNFIQLATNQSPEALLHNSRRRWLSAFDTLNRSFLKPLELPDEFGWHMLHERTKLFEVTFELFYLLTTRCGEVLSYQEDLTKSMICKLLDIASSLEVWLDVPDVPIKEGFPSPEELYAQCIKTLTAMLQALAGNAKMDHKGRPGWQILRSIGEECLAICSEVVASPPDAAYHVRMFEPPKVRTGRPPYPTSEESSKLAVAVDPKNYLSHAFICVHSPAQTPLILTLLLELLLNTLSTDPLGQSFVKALTLRAAEVTCQVYDFLVSPACFTSDTKRARALSRLVTAVCVGLQSIEPFNAIADPMRLHLLIRRLNDGPSDAWAKPDAHLVRAFSAPFAQPAIRADVHSVLILLNEEQWGDDGRTLRSLASTYLQTAAKTLDDRIIAEIAEFVASKAEDASYAGLVQALKDLENAAMPRDIEMADGACDWRRRVRQIVEAIIQPSEIDWMDDDDSTNDTQFISRALRDVEKRFGPIYNPSAAARLALLQQLARLPCALTRHDESACHSTQVDRPINSLRACMAVLNCAWDGAEREVTAPVRKAGYNALMRTLRHLPSTYSGSRLGRAAEIASRGVKDVDRNVRISAGRCFVELVNLYLRVTDDSEGRIEGLFAIIREILENGQDRWKETMLITLGQMSKSSSSCVLGKVVYLLVTQLAQPNPVIRGVASMQLSSAARHHKKAAYAFISPYLDTIAPFIVQRLGSHPSLLLEFCSFVSSTPKAFLPVLLPYTLPTLFANCDRAILGMLSQELGISIGQMAVQYGGKVYPHILLLSGPGQTRRAMTFILSFFPPEQQLTPGELVKADTTLTASEIIMHMGDEDQGTVYAAKQALLKMQQYLDGDGPCNDEDDAIRRCLDTQLLGVFSNFHNILQSTQAKYDGVKCKIITSLRVIIETLGHNVLVFGPQIMATMQTALALPGLAEATFKTWDAFFRIVKKEDVGGYVRATSAAVVSAWPRLSPEARGLAIKCLEYILSHAGGSGDSHNRDIVDLSSIPELDKIWQRVLQRRAEMTPHDRLAMILDRITSDNTAVAMLALQELKTFLLAEDERCIRGLTSGDIFDPLVGKVVPALFSVAAKDHEGFDNMRLLALECIGICGAIDPDRFQCDVQDSRITVKSNFDDEEESVSFVLHLIKDMLVGAFSSTYDIHYQHTLAYIIQQLTKFCRFTRSLVQPGAAGALPLKVRSRWNELPRSVRDVVGPLLDSNYTHSDDENPSFQPPFYPTQSTYREWLQVWTRHLIYHATGERAQQIFWPLRAIVQSSVKDVDIAFHIFPYLVLNGLLSENDEDVENIRAEILAVLEDQVNPYSASTVEKRELCAQAIFMLMDHLNSWIQSMRREMALNNRRKGAGPTFEELRVLRVESTLTSIDRSLVAKAALRCKAYARALMCFEQQVLDMGHVDDQAEEKVAAYETLHEIYAQLDEPDGMEGISTLILSPSLEHQIREHESTGRWTSAQSCWEVRLQQSPNDLKSHLGLLRCLRSLGHYDTMRTHVEGLLVRNPTWQAELIDYQIESGCIIGDWPTVQTLVDQTDKDSSPILLARVLLAMRSGNDEAVQNALQGARRILGAPIAAAGVRGYRHSYPAVLDLHILHELQTIYALGHEGHAHWDFDDRLDSLQRRLSERLDSTLPSFRYREPILSIRRTGLGLQIERSLRFREAIGRSWLLTARLARKAGYTQTAYSALLQAQHLDAPFWFVQSAKLAKAIGDPLKALQEIENWLERMKRAAMPMTQGQSVELTIVKAKVTTLRARWLAELNRHDRQTVIQIFHEGTRMLASRESGWFYSGRFHDECAKGLPSRPSDNELGDEAIAKQWALTRRQRLTMNKNTVRDLVQACCTGSKYIDQVLPRLLTLFLNVGDDDAAVYETSEFKAMVALMVTAIEAIPSYKWYTAFPQIVSRIGHPHDSIYNFLKALIRRVIQKHPNQALWQFTSVLQSKEKERRSRAEMILRKLKNPASGERVARLIEANDNLMKQLLRLCERTLPDKAKFSMRQTFSFLINIVPSPCIIPLQESLRAVMPPSPSLDAKHQPFPTDAPTFHQFLDEVEVMNSLAKPRKITIIGSDGRQYSFLGKPKDDLRKDARIMDFNAVINKQLKANEKTRRRQMYIRTYGVVTLNEECGFIQWVPNTIPLRTALQGGYQPRGLSLWVPQGDKIKKAFEKLSIVRTDREAADIFKREVLTEYPPVLHEWFLQMFPEPTAWLSSRVAYTRTAAVMCMVGFILGMGDRHSENLLLDTRSGDMVHVDFNCLFEKGKSLATPERVPFRLTQNVVDGFGVTGVEGAFRIACELAMQTLRDNRECLMIILDAFIHDPLVEWEEQKRHREAMEKKKGNTVKKEVNLEELAKGALGVISKKLQGIYALSFEKLAEKEIPTSSLVELLITEATDLRNLSRMYAGWSPHL